MIIKEYQKGINELVWYIHKIGKIQIFKNWETKEDNLTNLKKQVLELRKFLKGYVIDYGIDNDIYYIKINTDLDKLYKDLESEIKQLCYS